MRSINRQQLHHLLGHLPLILLALVAILTMMQACSDAGGDSGFGGYGYRRYY